MAIVSHLDSYGLWWWHFIESFHDIFWYIYWPNTLHAVCVMQPSWSLFKLSVLVLCLWLLHQTCILTVMSQLDYCNSIPIGLPQQQINCFQMFQNNSCFAGKKEHITYLLNCTGFQSMTIFRLRLHFEGSVNLFSCSPSDLCGSSCACHSGCVCNWLVFMHVCWLCVCFTAAKHIEVYQEKHYIKVLHYCFQNIVNKELKEMRTNQSYKL